MKKMLIESGEKYKNGTFPASVRWGFAQSEAVGAAGDVVYFLLQNVFSGLRCPSAFVPILHCFSSVTITFWFHEN